MRKVPMALCGTGFAGPNPAAAGPIRGHRESVH